MKKTLFKNGIRRKLLPILFYQEELKRDTILQEPLQQLVQDLQHRIFIHITKQCLDNYRQILQLALIDAVNVAYSLEGFLHSLSSLLGPHALCTSQVDHVLEGFWQPVCVVQILLCYRMTYWLDCVAYYRAVNVCREVQIELLG